jgi:hypothetical protein
MVRIIAHQGRQIKGDGEACLPLFQKVFEPPVRLLRCSVSGKFAQGPETATVHGGMNPPGKRIFSGKPDVLAVLQAGYVGGRIERLVDRQVGDRGKRRESLGKRLEARFVPCGSAPFIGLDFFVPLNHRISSWFITMPTTVKETN